MVMDVHSLDLPAALALAQRALAAAAIFARAAGDMRRRLSGEFRVDPAVAGRREAPVVDFPLAARTRAQRARAAAAILALPAADIRRAPVLGGKGWGLRDTASPRMDESSEVRVSICSLIRAARCRAAAVNCVKSMKAIISKKR